MVNGKVIQRTNGPDGQVTGTYDNNPFLNSIIYDVEFPDGQARTHLFRTEGFCSEYFI